MLNKKNLYLTLVLILFTIIGLGLSSISNIVGDNLLNQIAKPPSSVKNINIPPQVILGYSIIDKNSPGKVRLEAFPFDEDGTISYVEFYKESQEISRDRSAPYDYTATNLSVGVHTFTAKAYDNKRDSSLSQEVSIRIDEESLEPINGICSSTLNNCEAGLFSDLADTDQQKKWSCLGEFGGADASCSLNTTKAFRPFTEDSYWNRPIPDDAPIDQYSSLYIDEAMNSEITEPNYLRLTGTGENQWAIATAIDWAIPVYWANEDDPVYVLDSTVGYGPDNVVAHIPAGATPSQGSDGFIIVFDSANDQVVAMWQAVYDEINDYWTSTTIKRYILSSNGLSKRVLGTNSNINDGHRGMPPSILAITTEEVASGSIDHRLHCTWQSTGRPNEETPWYYWPLSGYEPDKGGIVPEGIVFRIKPEVNLEGRGLSPAALVIAQAMQNYGCVVGDNGGAKNNKLNLEFDLEGWAELDPTLNRDSLSSIPFTDYEFIQGGYEMK